jgi:P4 family phage/plasmid primase-like protien
MKRIERFKDYLIKELDSDLKTDIIKCKNENDLIDLFPDNFNEYQSNFGDYDKLIALKDGLKKLTDKRLLIKEFLRINPVFYNSSKIWWAWSKVGLCWIKIDETDILNMISNTTGTNTINSRERTEILETLKQEGRKIVPEDIPPYWVQFKDKIIDIMKNKEIKPTPKYFVTNPIPWEIGDSEETPVMDRIFEEWVGLDYVQTLYEIISYCLIPSYPIHRLFCLIGEGMNGKSKYLELVSKFIGRDNITTTELDTLLDSRFELGRLHKKLVCLVGETNFNEMKKTSILKKLTGGDLIGFEYKGKDPFEDYNYAKVIISTNNLPTTSDKTIGFYRRWTIIDFPNRFSEMKDILAEIPEEEYKNLAKKSIRVLAKLLTKRKFHNEGNINERMKKFEDLSNPLDKFFKENIVENLDNTISKYEFKNRLDDWCVENRFRKITDTFLGKKMKELGVGTIQKQADWYNQEGKKPLIRVWSGVKWKETTNKIIKNVRVNRVNRVNTQSHFISLCEKLTGIGCEPCEPCEQTTKNTSISSGNITCSECGMANLSSSEMFDDISCKVCNQKEAH